LRGFIKGSFLSRYADELFAGVAGGLLLALSFPPYPTRILSIVALVPLMRYFIRVFPAHAGRKGGLKRGFLAGYFFGAVFFLVLIFWISNLIPESSVNLSWVLLPGVILLILYLACYYGLFGLVIAWMTGRIGRRALWAAPAVWALLEYLRSKGELAFSWGVISSSLVKYPIAVQGVFALGPFGLAMLIVLVNLLIAVMIFSDVKRIRLAALVSLVAVTTVMLAGGALRIRRIDEEIGARAGSANVAVVQPNVDLGKKWDVNYRDSVFVQIEEIAGKAAAMGAELVIFPETAAPVSMSHQHRYRNWMKRISREAGVDIYIGYIRHEMENDRWRSFNSSGIFDGKGRLVTEYDKINLLQFGERIPFSQYIPLLEKIEFGQANFKKGRTQTIFESPAGRFGSLICFESTFSGYARRYVKEGAQFLVNVTNDGWFGSARGPLQHSETAILRAVENGVTLLRAANTGVSMYVDPAGRVIDRIGLDEEGILLVPVHTLSSITPYCRFGHLIFFGLALLNISVVGISALVGGKRH
jgi:apolipoprotein N-acyltransferase